jgi:hypothetical protein
LLQLTQYKKILLLQKVYMELSPPKPWRHTRWGRYGSTHSLLHTRQRVRGQLHTPVTLCTS